MSARPNRIIAQRNYTTPLQIGPAWMLARRSIAERHKESLAQVILRWLTQRGAVAIPKSVRRESIVENFSVFDFELSIDDTDAIRSLDNKQFAFFDHRDPKIVKMIAIAKSNT